MTDLNDVPVSPPIPEGSPADKGPSGFFGTRNGKIAIGVIAVLVMLGIVGALAFAMVSGGILGLFTPAPAGPPLSTGAAKGSVEATVVITEPPAVPLSTSFTFRNVFAPTVKPPVAPSTVSSTATSTASGSTNSPDTLYLIDIVDSESGKQAVFVWNGATYTVSEGEVVAGSPWKVLEIYGDSVLMLYGDSQVTLTVGQGLTK